MALAYRYVLRQMSLRVNAVLATTAAAMQTAYVTSPLTTAEVNSPIFPFASLQDAVLLAEGRFVNAIANSAHPYRSYLRVLTGAVANEGALPTASSGSVPLVGIPGSIYDSSDGTPCDWWPLREVTLRSANAGSFFKADAYGYNITGSTVYHTRTNVIIEACGYSDTAQRTAIAANGNSVLPDDLEAGLVDEGLRQLVRDDEFVTQQNLYGAIADAWLTKFPAVDRIAL